MLVQQKILSIVFLNIKQVKVQNIHRDASRLNLFILKSMKESLMPTLEKNRFKIGAEQEEKS